jgi:hypothetical protein
LDLAQQDGEAVDRQEFEYLRDLPDKVIADDIYLKPKRPNSSVLASGPIPIHNNVGTAAILSLEFNLETDSKSINVRVVGIGPICRLEIDAREHRPYGRSHKHALRSAECPEQNLKKDITDQSKLSGGTIREVFAEFCRAAHISFEGQFRE